MSKGRKMMMRLGVVALALMPIVQSAMFLPEQIHLALGKTPGSPVEGRFLSGY